MGFPCWNVRQRRCSSKHGHPTNMLPNPKVEDAFGFFVTFTSDERIALGVSSLDIQFPRSRRRPFISSPPYWRSWQSAMHQIRRTISGRAPYRLGAGSGDARLLQAQRPFWPMRVDLKARSIQVGAHFVGEEFSRPEKILHVLYRRLFQNILQVRGYRSCRKGSGLDPRYIFSSTGVDADHISFVDELRHNDLQAGLGAHLFGDPGGRIAADGSFSINDLQVH